MQIRLPIYMNKELNIGGNSENLFMYLEPINSDRIRERIGKEVVFKNEDDLIVTRGQIFSSPDQQNKIRGYRYIIKNSDGDFIACTNVTKINRSAVVSNIYVRIDHRRTGLATRLIERIKKDHLSLFVDSSLTNLGASFFGYEKNKMKMKF